LLSCEFELTSVFFLKKNFDFAKMLLLSFRKIGGGTLEMSVYLPLPLSRLNKVLLEGVLLN